MGGHEGAGIVVAVGSLVEDVKVGDHAGVKVSCVHPSVPMKTLGNRKASINSSIVVKWKLPRL